MKGVGLVGELVTPRASREDGSCPQVVVIGSHGDVCVGGAVQHLAAQEPARHTPNLAHSLTSLGVSLGELGRYRDALARNEEAVSLRRDLAAQEPARHTPDLAHSLHNLGVDLGEVGRPRDAVAAFEEAVGLARNLAAQEPARHTPALANSLVSLGFGLLKVGRPREALDAFEEAVKLRRGLVAQEPARHTPDLAHSLHNLGVSLGKAGRLQKALDAFEEAVGLARDLAIQEPARHTPYLATLLTNLAIALCQLDRHDEELGLRAETTVRWRILSQLDPDEYEDAYQRERDRLAASFSEHGREPDAAWQAEEDLARRLGLARHHPSAQRSQRGIVESLSRSHLVISSLVRPPPLGPS